MRAAAGLIGLLLGLAPAAALADDDFTAIATALSSGNAPEARRLADAGLAQSALSDADRARLLLDRGLADAALQDGDEALADLTRAIETHALDTPDSVRAFLERGLVLDRMNRLKDAVGDYGAAIALMPNSAAALNNRANALRRLDRLDEARRDYQASLAAGNSQPQYPYYGLGQIAERQGDTQAARGFYAQAVAADAGYGLAADRLAALGGAPDAAPIVLKPPAGTVTAADDAPIVLKPPPGVRAAASSDDAPIHLRPPAATQDAKKTAGADDGAGPTITPASYGGDDDPGLRPALDTRRAGPHPEAGGGGQLVQLGAWRGEEEAAQGWNSLVRRAGGLLDGLAPHIVTADLPGRGRYYRLRTGPLGRDDAARLCAALTAKGLDCMPVRD